MKPLSFLILFALGPLVLHAQNDSLKLPNRVIKMNPWEFIDQTFFLELEKYNDQANESWTFGLGLKTGYNWQGDEMYGTKVELGKRYYLKGLSVHQPKKDRNPYLVGVFAGFYLRGIYTYKNQEEVFWDSSSQVGQNQTNERSIISVFPGVQIGVTRTFWDILYVEGYVGGGVRYAFVNDSNPDFANDLNYDSYYDVSDEEYRGVAPNIGMKVGVAF